MSRKRESCEWVAHHLPWYLNGTLDDEAEKRLQAHLEDCDACKAELEETRASFEFFDRHLPLEILEDLARGKSLTGEAAEVAPAHLAQCKDCHEQLLLMESSWQQLLATPDPNTPDPKPFFWSWVPALAAAVLIAALGWGWWSSYRTLKALTPDAKPPALTLPRTNLVSKDLFPQEMARRGNADQAIHLFEGYRGLALTLHSQLPESEQPFQLEIKTASGKVLWRTDQVVGQENGLISLFIPVKFLAKGALTLTLATSDSGLTENYRLDTQSHR